MKWYKYDIRDLSDAEYQKWYCVMNDDKKHRVDGLRFLEDKKRAVAGDMLARKAVAEWCGVSVEDISFKADEHGKPRAQGLAVEFNISHSGDMAVCAVSDRAVGIDIEKLRPLNLNTSKRAFTEDELVSLFGRTPVASDFVKTEDPLLIRRFFEIWTAKEAALKCASDVLANIRQYSSSATQQFLLHNEYIVSIKLQD